MGEKTYINSIKKIIYAGTSHNEVNEKFVGN